MTLEKLLKMQVESENSVTGEKVQCSPEFRVAVQNTEAEIGGKKGVHVIIHASGHNSDTLDLLVAGNNTFKIY